MALFIAVIVFSYTFVTVRSKIFLIETKDDDYKVSASDGEYGTDYYEEDEDIRGGITNSSKEIICVAVKA